MRSAFAGRSGLDLAGPRVQSAALMKVLTPLVSLAALSGLALAVITAPLLPIEPTMADLERSHAVLKAWEETEPENGKRVMRVVYWTPADREPQPAFRERLTRVMKSVQSFYLREMEAVGFAGRTIGLDVAADGLLNLPIARGTLKSEECSESDGSDGQAIRRDCVRALAQVGIDGEKETLVIFCNLADWDPEKRRMSHHSPYYASGDSTRGTAWQLDSPLLDSDLLGVKDQHLEDGQYGRISLGKYNSIFVGGVCHEIGHALGLPHCRECPPLRALRGTALMGSGNRTYGEELRGESKGSFLALPHALKLAAHPQFSGSVKQMGTKVKVDFADWKMEATEDGLRVRAKVTSNLPCHAVLAYGDPEGGSDYDAAIAVGVPQADGHFTLVLPKPDRRNRPAALSFVGVCVNGAATASVWSEQAFTMSCRIDEAGNYDVSGTMAAIAFQEHVASARAGTLSDAVRTTLKPSVQEALRRLLLPETRERLAAAAVAETVKQLPLSDSEPAHAVTGYGGVHYDRTDRGEPLVGAEGPVAHGLWAHANAEHRFALGGKWSTLRGAAGLVNGANGSVVAVIEADGKELWKSPELKQGMTAPFTLPVVGVTSLTLRMRAVKGIGNAHSAWLEPTLERP
jgi:hypothetical protein